MNAYYFLTSTFYPSIGGVEVGIHNLAIRLANMGNEIIILCPWKSINMPNKQKLPYKIVSLFPKFFYFVKFYNFKPFQFLYLFFYKVIEMLYKPDFWHISMSYPAGFSF